MVWSSWGKSWDGGSGTSQTIFVDSFDLEMDVEEAILVDNDEVEILLDNSEFVLEQEETILSVEEEEFLLELEEEV